MRYMRLWLGLGLVIAASFAVLGYFGGEVYRQAPPVPERVVTTEGRVVYTGQDIKEGQNVWQSLGGQEVGTVWGHGGYVAPDWSADYLHREATWMLDHWAALEGGGKSYAVLGSERRAALKARLKDELRHNGYDPATGNLTVSPLRAEAMASVASHYDSLFGDDAELDKLRDAYAIPAGAIKTPERRKQLAAFFFWTSWACSTNRPGAEISYTNNWPSEDLIDNHPSGQVVVWSVVSFVLLLAGIGALSWYFAAENRHGDDNHELPAEDPLLALHATPSMRATLKYFWVVTALMVVQVGLGAVTAHYGVEGSGFYGIPSSID